MDEICDRPWRSDARSGRTMGGMTLLPPHRAFLALAAGGVLFGLTVPLSKVALGWLDPAWLTVARFALAAPVLALVGPPPPARGARRARRRLGRRRATPRWSSCRTPEWSGRASATPRCCSAPCPPSSRSSRRCPAAGASGPLAWLGFGVALGGVGLVAGSGGGVVAGRRRPHAAVGALPGGVRRRPGAACSTAAIRSRSRPCRWLAAALVALPVALAGGSPPALGAASASDGRRGRGTRRRGHAAAVRVLRLRPGARAAGGRGRVRQSRAAGRRRASPCSRSATPSARCRRSARARSSPGSRSAARRRRDPLRRAARPRPGA